MMGKSWIGGVHALGVLDDGFAFREKACYGESHGDAVVAVAIDHGGVQRLPTFDFHAVFELLDLGSHSAEVVDDGGDAVGFFDAEFLGVADDGATLGQCCRNGDDWNFIDEVRDFIDENRGTGEGGAVEFDVADGFACGLVNDFRHVRAHAAEDFENGGAGRVEADVFDEQAGAGDGGGGDEPEGRAGNVAGHGEIAGLGDLTAVEGDCVVFAVGGDAEGGHHPLGVVAGFGRLDDGGLALGKKPCKEHGAFYLCAGDGHLVGNRGQFGGMDAQGSAAGFLAEGLDIGTHLAERDGDAAHGPGRQRGVTEELGGECLACEKSGEQAHAGAGISAVDGGSGGAEFHRLTTDAEVGWAVVFEFVEDFIRRAERLHSVECVDAVLAGEEVADGASAVGESAENGGAVGHAFVAGDAKLCVQF